MYMYMYLLKEFNCVQILFWICIILLFTERNVLNIVNLDVESKEKKNVRCIHVYLFLSLNWGRPTNIRKILAGICQIKYKYPQTILIFFGNFHLKYEYFKKTINLKEFFIKAEYLIRPTVDFPRCLIIFHICIQFGSPLIMI